MRSTAAVDYVEQGEGRFYLPTMGVRVNVISQTCSCDCPKCEHIGVAKLAALVSMEHDALNGEQLEWLLERLSGTRDSLRSALGELMGCSEGSIAGLELTNLITQAEDYFEGRILQCKRCDQWVDWDEGSEDVDGICLGCVR